MSSIIVLSLDYSGISHQKQLHTISDVYNSVLGPEISNTNTHQVAPNFKGHDTKDEKKIVGVYLNLKASGGNFELFKRYLLANWGRYSTHFNHSSSLMMPCKMLLSGVGIQSFRAALQIPHFEIVTTHWGILIFPSYTKKRAIHINTTHLLLVFHTL